MHDYYEWLKPLSPLSWAELAEMEPDQRVASVKKLAARRAAARRGQAARPQRHGSRVEVDERLCTTRHEAALLASLPEAQRKLLRRIEQTDAASDVVWADVAAMAGRRLRQAAADDDRRRISRGSVQN